jgi:hypothetical protein
LRHDVSSYLLRHGDLVFQIALERHCCFGQKAPSMSLFETSRMGQERLQ